MTTAAQIRAARALIGKSIDDLAVSSGLQAAVITALEAGQADAPPGALEKLKSTLESQGVIFVASGDQDPGGSGVRLSARSDADDGLRPDQLNATNDD
jgi:ribosome-binding protein aMBF1 (putative translation factor)